MYSTKVLIYVIISVFTHDCSQHETADLIFKYAKVYTVSEDQPWAEAVGIKDDKIVFVRTGKDAGAFMGSETEVTDLEGKYV